MEVVGQKGPRGRQYKTGYSSWLSPELNSKTLLLKLAHCERNQAGTELDVSCLLASLHSAGSCYSGSQRGPIISHSVSCSNTTLQGNMYQLVHDFWGSLLCVLIGSQACSSGTQVKP